MAWLAVDKEKGEIIASSCPGRYGDTGWHRLSGSDSIIPIPKGSIKKLTGKNLTWDDDPVEI